MRMAIKIVLVAFPVFLGLTLDYSLAAKAAGADYGLARHLEARLAGLDALMPGPALAKALPDAPEGWTARAVTEEDSFLVSGLPATPESLANVRKVEAAMAESIKGMTYARRLYQSGEDMIYLDVTFVPANARGTRGARLSEGLFRLYAARAGEPINPEAGDFALRRYGAPEFGRARLYFAQVGGQVFISALSTAHDPATLAVLAGIDQAALRRMIAVDPTIGEPAVVEKAETAARGSAGTKADPATGCVTRGAAKFCSAGN